MCLKNGVAHPRVLLLPELAPRCSMVDGRCSMLALRGGGGERRHRRLGKTLVAETLRVAFRLSVLLRESAACRPRPRGLRQPVGQRFSKSARSVRARWAREHHVRTVNVGLAERRVQPLRCRVVTSSQV